ncbi:MAG TPA: hypothetical protein PKJ24_00590 [Prolixibacteraceae bacterium]|nr:hypothetical protein [Prolixibacteraceae bacterium]
MTRVAPERSNRSPVIHADPSSLRFVRMTRAARTEGGTVAGRHKTLP